MPWNSGPTSRGILARHAVESAVKFLLGTLSFIFMRGHPKKRAIHDIVGSTIVIDARSMHDLQAA
jgi:uncharacterized RDD family membrane protein YckC